MGKEVFERRFGLDGKREERRAAKSAGEPTFSFLLRSSVRSCSSSSSFARQRGKGKGGEEDGRRRRRMEVKIGTRQGKEGGGEEGNAGFTNMERRKRSID